MAVVVPGMPAPDPRCRSRLLDPPSPLPRRRPLQGGDGALRGTGNGGGAAARRGQPPHPGLPVAGGAGGVAQALH